MSDPSPKTDLEKLTELMTEFGVHFTQKRVHENEPSDIRLLVIPSENANGDRDGKNDGYVDFEAVFEFDTAGKFLSVGIWE